MNKEKVKIRMISGRIITLAIESETDTQLSGTDLFGKWVIVSKDEIKELRSL